MKISNKSYVRLKPSFIFKKVVHVGRGTLENVCHGTGNAKSLSSDGTHWLLSIEPRPSNAASARKFDFTLPNDCKRNLTVFSKTFIVFVRDTRLANDFSSVFLPGCLGLPRLPDIESSSIDLVGGERKRRARNGSLSVFPADPVRRKYEQETKYRFVSDCNAFLHRPEERLFPRFSLTCREVETKNVRYPPSDRE